MEIQTTNTNKRKIVWETIYIALLGIIAFSRIGQYLLVNVLGLRFYLIEIFFIPFFIYERRNLKRYLSIGFRHVRGFFLICIVFVDILIGCAYTGDLIDVVTMTRSILYIVIAFIYFYEKKTFSTWKILILSIGSIVGELFYALMLRSTSITSINTMCIAAAIIVSTLHYSYWLIGLSSGLSLIISISSGYRIGIVVTVLIMLEMIVWSIINRKKIQSTSQLIKKIGIPFSIVIFASIVVINFDSIVGFVAEKFNMDAYAIYRVTNRLKALVQFDLAGANESTRLEGFKLIFSTFFDRLLPRGLVGKSTGTLGTYIDVPITYFYDAFGSLVSIPILLSCLHRGSMSFLQSFQKDTPDFHRVAGLMFPLFVVFIMINGNFLYITYQCILTGMFSGIWFSQIKPIVEIKRR